MGDPAPGVRAARPMRPGHAGRGSLAALTLLLSLAPAVARANQAPIVDSFTASSLSVAPGALVDLSVQAHDPDCAAAPCTAASGCGNYVRGDLVGWSATGGGFPVTNLGASGSPFATTAQWQAPAGTGNFTITVSVPDSGTFMCGGRLTASASLTIQVTTTPNQPPVITSLSAGATTLFPGQSLIVTAAATDPDGDPITYAWSTTAGTIIPGIAGLASFDAPSAPGTADITCTVTDSKGASVSRVLTVTTTEAMPERTINAGLRAPQRLAINSAGEAFVVDRDLGGVVILGLFSGGTTGFWPIDGARGVAVDWSDRIVIGADTGAAVFDRTASLVRVLDPGAVLGPVADVAVDVAGRRYAVLYGEAGRVVVFTEAGAVAFSFGANGDAVGQLKSADGLSVSASGDIVVGDNGHALVQQFAGASGAFVQAFGGYGVASGKFSQLAGVAALAAGRVAAADGFHSTVQVFNGDGTLRETIGGYGDELGRLKTPAGIAFSDQFKRLAVASINLSRLDVFRVSGMAAAQPMLALSTTLATFGSQRLGLTATGPAVTLSSVGTAPVTLTSTVASGDFFVAGSTCGATLLPGQNCVVTLGFTPAAAGQRLGTLTVTSSAPPSPQIVQLRGTGTAVAVGGISANPALLDFGGQIVGQASSGRNTLVLNNDLVNPVTLGSVGISGSNPGDFSIASDGCSGRQLGPGGSCALAVTFTPALLGPRSAQIDVGVATGVVQLRGAGADASAPIPTLTPSGLVVLGLLVLGGGVVAVLRRRS